MKIKKIISMLLCIAMFSTLFVGLQTTSVGAAKQETDTEESSYVIMSDTDDMDDYDYDYEMDEYDYEYYSSTATIITVEHDHTIEDIVAASKKYEHSGFDGEQTRYDETPRFTSPYKAGSLNQDDLSDAENAVKMVRFLAGVPYNDVKFDPELNDIAQHGSVLLAASDQFGHSPYQPDDMDDDFYEIAYRGCSESNISYGRNNISSAVIGFLYDGGQNNITLAGHRRWILNPGNQNFGIGYANYEGSSYQGDRINMYVFDGLDQWECESDSYIAWPAAGYFPIQYFAASDYIEHTIEAPWSVNLGSPYRVPDKDSIELCLTRKRDGQTWTFDSDTPDLGDGGYNNDNNMHLAVDNQGYGIGKAIVFRPDLNSLGEIKDGDVFNVTITGIEYIDGTSAELSYDINFFDLEAYLKSNVIVNVRDNGMPVEDATVSIDGKSLTTDSDGNASIRLENNKSYTYTVSKDGYDTEKGSIEVEESEITQRVNLAAVATPSPVPSATPYHTSSDGSSGGGSNFITTYSTPTPGSIDFESESSTSTKRFTTFSDVPTTHWAHSYIEDLCAAGVVNGVGNGLFLPDDNVTRAEFAKMACELFGLSANSTTTQFKDVSHSDWYFDYVIAATEAGIVNGTSLYTFSPDENVTREQMAAIIGRYFDLKSNSALAYRDESSIEEYALPYVTALTKSGLLTGDNGYFRPADTATRAEAATLLDRVRNNI